MSGSDRSGFALALRRFAWWLLSPAAYASATLAARTRCRVLIGPFRGMRYRFSDVARVRLDGALQVGSYELEVHERVEELIELEPRLIVNVGAAAGYYCVGLANRLPEARVLAYETEADNRAAARSLAAVNRVAERIELRGTCDLDEFSGLEEELSGERVAVVMDCEGLELELLDPGAVAWLAGATVLAELHPSVEARMAETLAERLGETHAVTIVASRERWASSLPELWRMPGLRNVDRELLVAEHRHGEQQWLWASPLRPAP